jgi:rRNA maturation protein Rpf1
MLASQLFNVPAQAHVDVRTAYDVIEATEDEIVIRGAGKVDIVGEVRGGPQCLDHQTQKLS